jgi:hypothetical protein
LKLMNIWQISKGNGLKKVSFDSVTHGFKSCGKALRGDEGGNWRWCGRKKTFWLSSFCQPPKALLSFLARIFNCSVKTSPLSLPDSSSLGLVGLKILPPTKLTLVPHMSPECPSSFLPLFYSLLWLPENTRRGWLWQGNILDNTSFDAWH